MRSLLADRWFVVFLSILFFNGAISGPLSTFLSIYVADGLGQDQTLAANLRTVSLLFMAIFALVGGITSDALGSRSTLFVGVLGTAAAAAIFLTESPPVLFLLAAAEGAGLGMLSTGSQSYLLNATWVGRVGTATGLYFAGRSLGSVAGDPIGGAILQWWDFRTLGLIALIALVPVLVAVFALPSGGAGEREKTAGLRTVLAGIAEIVKRSEVLTLSLMQYFRTTFWGAAGLALPFLLKQLTDSNLAVGWFSAAALAAGVMAVLVMGPVSDRIGRRFAVLAAVSAMVSGAVLLAIFAGSAAGIFARRDRRLHRRLDAFRAGAAARQAARARRRGRTNDVDCLGSVGSRQPYGSPASRFADRDQPHEPFSGDFGPAGDCAAGRVQSRILALSSGRFGLS